MLLSEALRETENGEKSMEYKFNSFAGRLPQRNFLLEPKMERYLCMMKVVIYFIRYECKDCKESLSLKISLLLTFHWQESTGLNKPRCTLTILQLACASLTSKEDLS